MKNIIFLFLIFNMANSAFAEVKMSERNLKKEHKTIDKMLSSIFDHNALQVKDVPDDLVSNAKNLPSPRATVVTCSDSIVESTGVDTLPINDTYFVINMGNQVKTAHGSVEYGVRHLKTPVLLIIGHVKCQAIKTALSDKKDRKKLSSPIKKELDAMKLHARSAKLGVLENIHSQVKAATQEFAVELMEKRLVILGAVFDSLNEYGHGFNRLILINVNGENDPKLIRKNDFLINLQDIIVGVEKAK